MFNRVLKYYPILVDREMGNKYLPFLTSKWNDLCTRAMKAEHFLLIKGFLSHFILSLLEANAGHACVAQALRLDLFSTLVNECLCLN